MTKEPIQNYYLVEDGKIIGASILPMNYGGFRYTSSGVTRLPTSIKLSHKIITVYNSEDIKYLENNMIWRHLDEYKKIIDYDDFTLDGIINVSLKRNNTTTNGDIFKKVLSGMLRRRKIHKLMDNIDE